MSWEGVGLFDCALDWVGQDFIPHPLYPPLATLFCKAFIVIAKMQHSHNNRIASFICRAQNHEADIRMPKGGFEKDKVARLSVLSVICEETNAVSEEVMYSSFIEMLS